MLAPTLEHVLGRPKSARSSGAEGGKVAGCYVTEGVIGGGEGEAHKEGVVFWKGPLALRRFKDDAREVSAGYECGMSFSNQQDFRRATS